MHCSLSTTYNYWSSIARVSRIVITRRARARTHSPKKAHYVRSTTENELCVSFKVDRLWRWRRNGDKMAACERAGAQQRQLQHQVPGGRQHPWQGPPPGTGRESQHEPGLLTKKIHTSMVQYCIMISFKTQACFSLFSVNMTKGFDNNLIKGKLKWQEGADGQTWKTTLPNPQFEGVVDKVFDLIQPHSFSLIGHRLDI